MPLCLCGFTVCYSLASMYSAVVTILLLSLLQGQSHSTLEDVVRRATAAREARQFDQAITLYQEAVRLDPSWGEGWWHLGNVLYETRKFREARDAFQKLTKLQPAAGPAWALVGLSEFQLKNYDAASQTLDRARGLGVGANEHLSALTHYHAAILLTRSGRLEPARQILLALLGKVKDNPALLEALGINALAMSAFPSEISPEKRDLVLRAGKAAYLSAVRQIDEAEKEFNALLKLYPNEPNVHYNYGVFLQFEDTDAALREFLKEIEVFPSHVSARVSIALEYTRRGDLKSALPLAEQAVEIDPRRSETQLTLGRILLDLGELDRAVDHLEKAASLAPDNPRAHYLLARAYARTGHDDKAERERAEFLRLKSGEQPR